jgi:hypothetical protein
MIDYFKIAGAIGLMMVVAGVLLRKRNVQDELYFLGGIFLISYSIHIGDWVFILLQVVFILAAAYDLVKSWIFKQKKK